MAARKTGTQSQSDVTSDQGTAPAAPKSLSLLAQEEFGDAFHGEVQDAPPKPEPIQEPVDDEPELPEIPDEELEEGGENKQIEGDEKLAVQSQDAGVEEPIATVRELVEHLEADPEWFDNLKVDVTVNGNPSQVPLKDVIESFRTNQAADERLELAKSKSAQAQQETAQRNAALEQQYQVAAQLVQMQEQELTAENAAINWAELKRDDPAMWSAEKVRLGERQQKIQQTKAQIAGQYQYAMAQQMQDYQNQRAAKMEEQSQLLLAAMPKVSPDWGDQQKLPERKSGLMTYLVGQGFSHKEIEDTLDHRAFIVAEKARLWDESQGKVQLTKKRIRTVPKVMKPGARKEPAAINLEKVRAARQALARTGDPEAAYALIKAEKARR